MLAQTLFALSALLPSGLMRGDTLAPATTQDLVSSLHPGEVLVLGELHDSEDHHRNQVRILEGILKDRADRNADFPISVGFEFFERDTQETVDRYLGSELSEEQFLQEVRWSGGPYSGYREQALFSRRSGGTTLALNAPRALTSRIARVGISGLTQAERSSLPEGFTLGNDLYKERFTETMSGHASAEAINRYFEAQSAWDETMADTAARFLKEHPDHLLVVIVGDFHIAYGGGLPDRLRARGVHVTTVSQTRLAGSPEEARRAELLPHPRYGARGDFIWDVP